MEVGRSPREGAKLCYTGRGIASLANVQNQQNPTYPPRYSLSLVEVTLKYRAPAISVRFPLTSRASADSLLVLCSKGIDVSLNI
jgi:hypothetical protein